MVFLRPTAGLSGGAEQKGSSDETILQEPAGERGLDGGACVGTAADDQMDDDMRCNDSDDDYCSLEDENSNDSCLSHDQGHLSYEESDDSGFDSDIHSLELCMETFEEADLTADDYHYPDGDIQLKSRAPLKDVRFLGYAYRRIGGHTGQSESSSKFCQTEVCQGIWECPDCCTTARPLTDHNRSVGARPKAAEKCMTCFKATGQTIPMIRQDCEASVSYTRFDEDGSIIIQHSGMHAHARPRRKCLTSHEMSQLSTIVKFGGTITPSQMSRAAEPDSAAMNAASNKKRIATVTDNAALLSRKGLLLVLLGELAALPGVIHRSVAGSHFRETLEWFSICADWQIAEAERGPFSMCFDATHDTVEGYRDMLLSSAMIKNSTMGKFIPIYSAFHWGKTTAIFAQLFTEMFAAFGAPGDHFQGLSTDWDDAQILGWVTACLRASGHLDASTVFRWAGLSNPDLRGAAMQSLSHVRGCWFHFCQAMHPRFESCGVNAGRVKAAFTALLTMAKRGHYETNAFNKQTEEAWQMLGALSRSNTNMVADTRQQWLTDHGGIRWRLMFDIGPDTIRSKLHNTTNAVESAHRTLKFSVKLTNVSFHLAVSKIVQYGLDLHKELKVRAAGANIGPKPDSREQRPRKFAGSSKGKSRGSGRKKSKKTRRSIQQVTSTRSSNGPLPLLPSGGSPLSGEHALLLLLLSFVTTSERSLKSDHILNEVIQDALQAWTATSRENVARERLNALSARLMKLIANYGLTTGYLTCEDRAQLLSERTDCILPSLFAVIATAMCAMLEDAWEPLAVNRDDSRLSSNPAAHFQIAWQSLTPSHPMGLGHQAFEEAIDSSKLTALVVFELTDAAGGQLPRDVSQLAIPCIFETPSGAYELRGTVEWNGVAYRPSFLHTAKGSNGSSCPSNWLTASLSLKAKRAAITKQGPFQHLDGIECTAGAFLPSSSKQSTYRTIFFLYGHKPDVSRAEAELRAGGSALPLPDEAGHVLAEPQALLTVMSGEEVDELEHKARLVRGGLSAAVHEPSTDTVSEAERNGRMYFDRPQDLTRELAHGDADSVILLSPESDESSSKLPVPKSETLTLSLSQHTFDNTGSILRARRKSGGKTGGRTSSKHRKLSKPSASEEDTCDLCTRAILERASFQDQHFGGDGWGARLYDHTWYNDECMDAYLQHLEHLQREKHGLVRFVSTMTFSFLCNENTHLHNAAAFVAESSLTVTDWEKAIIATPVSLTERGGLPYATGGSFHWVLLVLERSTRKARVLTSSRSPVRTAPIVQALTNFETRVSAQLGAPDIGPASFDVETLRPLMQHDGSSCGPFVCHFAEEVAKQQTAQPKIKSKMSGRKMRARVRQVLGFPETPDGR